MRQTAAHKGIEAKLVVLLCDYPRLSHKGICLIRHTLYRTILGISSTKVIDADKLL